MLTAGPHISLEIENALPSTFHIALRADCSSPNTPDTVSAKMIAPTTSAKLLAPLAQAFSMASLRSFRTVGPYKRRGFGHNRAARSSFTEHKSSDCNHNHQNGNERGYAVKTIAAPRVRQSLTR